MLVYAVYVPLAVALAIYGPTIDPDVASDEFYLAMSPTTFAVIGTPMFFLLVLRTNSSYDRWWEGRKIWGAVTNRTRDFARQVIAYIADEGLRERLVRHDVAFAAALKQTLRRSTDLSELQGVLPAKDLADVAGARHMVLSVLQRMSADLREAHARGLVDSVEKMALDLNLTAFEDYTGMCERILKTKLPFAYVSHLRTYLLLWLALLPFALVHHNGWFSVPLCFIVAYALFGMEMIGVEVEQPFGARAVFPRAGVHRRLDGGEPGGKGKRQRGGTWPG